MRYSRIEIHGTPSLPFAYYYRTIYNTDNLKKLGEPLVTTDDGILFYIEGLYERYILIPETHFCFNKHILSDMCHYIKEATTVDEEVDEWLTTNYWAPLYQAAYKEYSKREKT